MSDALSIIPFLSLRVRISVIVCDNRSAISTFTSNTDPRTIPYSNCYTCSNADFYTDLDNNYMLFRIAGVNSVVMDIFVRSGLPGAFVTICCAQLLPSMLSKGRKNKTENQKFLF